MDAEDCQYAENYKIHCLLGDGGQANVYLGSKENKLYALKVYLPGASKEEAFKIEVDFLSKLNFPHLINIVDSKIDAKVKLAGKGVEVKPLIVLELAEGGELFEFISKQGKFKPDVCRAYTKQLISAVKYLVDQGVTHRDIKPENILFDGEFKLRVSDFGLSRMAVGDNKDFKLYSKVGTQGYKPPEMEAGNYTGFQADIFAVGVVLFVMYNGTPPFMSTKPHDKIYKLIREKNFVRFWQLHENKKPVGTYPQSFKRLINAFFSADINHRPTIQSLAEDEWMSGDEPMQNDIYQYMKEKYDLIAQNDAVKKKIEAAKKELFVNKVMEEEKGCCEGEEEEQDNRGVNDFVRDYKDCSVKAESLDKYEMSSVVYSKQNPAFIMAWVKNFLKESFKSGETFLPQDFFLDVKPISFIPILNEETNELSITLQFEVEGDEEELGINGKFHQSEKGIGIEWVKVEGNEFWLTSLITKLNASLRSIA